MEPVRQVRSRTVVVPAENVDTDQIIPARFLTTTQRDGLGRHAFADWRFDDSGKPRPDCVFNAPESAGCEVLVAGRNFGCGSSREHAPWALLDYGLRAVISSEIADIFKSNALKNGLVAVEVAAEDHDWLLAKPGVTVTVDVAGGTVSYGEGRQARFDMEPFARHCLLNGQDPMGFLLDQADAIARYEKHNPCAPA